MHERRSSAPILLLEFVHEVRLFSGSELNYFLVIDTPTRSFLLCLTHIMVKKVLLLGQIFEMEILINLHVMRTPKSKNHIFNISSLCMCVCQSTKLKNKLQQKTEIWYSTFVSYIDATWNFSWTSETTLCTGVHKILLIHYCLWTEFLVI